MRTWMTFALCLAPALAAAQDQQDWVKPEEQGKAVEEAAKAPDGWHYKLTLGSNGSYSNNDSVVGSDDGNYFQLGVLLNGEAKWRSGQHSWATTLSITHQQSMTPTIDGFVKSADAAELKSIYRYALASTPWLGPFGRVRLTTQLFPTNVVRGKPTTLVFQDSAGVEQRREDLAAGDRERIAEGFEPLVLRETAGVFADPYEDKQFTLNLTLGAGAQEVFAQDGYVVAKVDDDADLVEVKQLQSYEEVGVELEAVASGELADNASWQVSANVLHPFVTSADTDLEGVELTNVELGAKLALRLNSWASLDYVFTAKKIPVILDAWQLQHNLLLTAAFSIL